MLIEEKYFDQDKNYLLKTVQAFGKESLLNGWTDEIFRSYTVLHNPMGLLDDFMIELREKIIYGKDLLEDAYDLVAAIYRFYHSDNQLEFQWDGRSHMESYDEEWKTKFSQWIAVLSSIKEIQRPIIRYTTQDLDINNDFLKASIRRGILGHFKVRLRSQKLYQISA